MKTSSKIVGGIIVVLVGVGAYVYESMSNSASVVANQNDNPNPISTNPDTSVSTDTQNSNNTPTPTTTDTNTKTKYKNGTYNVTDTYFTPAGKENLGVSVTISGDKVANATVTSMANDGDSKMYQMRFISRFSSQVVGQNVDSAKADTSSGSSLTSGAFNDALAKIKKQALI